MTYIYKNRERHIVLILRLETGDFDFRIKQKTLSYVDTDHFSGRRIAKIHFLFNMTLFSVTIILCS